MHVTLRIIFHQFYWSVILGIVMGIFGISLSIINIANFYLQEGAETRSNITEFYIQNTAGKPLNNQSLSELRNIEGVAFVHPYFNSSNNIEAGINYLGFEATYPIQIKGIPQIKGIKNVSPSQRNVWGSIDLETIPVLLPQQAINIYNNLAPQRGWPALEENAFLGLPGTVISIDGKTYKAVITGFDPDELGNTAIAPAQKLFSIYEAQELNPTYSELIIESVAGLNRQQLRDLSKNISDLGYDLNTTREESFQVGLFTRVKYTIAMLGFGILIAFIILKYFSFHNLLRKYRERLWIYRIWGIPDTIIVYIMTSTIIFSVVCGILSWIISFFGVIPAQEYILQTLIRFGLNTPSLKESARTALESGFIGTGIYFFISIITTFLFYYKTPKAHFIKKF